MKRSRSIRLMLIGGLSVSTLSGCGNPERTPLSEQNVYTNNFFVPGAGYYHAPFRAWYALPYNHFDSQKQSYFFGGQWAAAPHQSFTNISEPTAHAVQQAQPQPANVRRGGFGSSSRSHFIHS